MVAGALHPFSPEVRGVCVSAGEMGVHLCVVKLFAPTSLQPSSPLQEGGVLLSSLEDCLWQNESGEEGVHSAGASLSPSFSLAPPTNEIRSLFARLLCSAVIGGGALASAA